MSNKVRVIVCVCSGGVFSSMGFIFGFGFFAAHLAIVAKTILLRRFLCAFTELRCSFPSPFDAPNVKNSSAIAKETSLPMELLSTLRAVELPKN